ncbi:sensor histidine kinase [Virgisporangium ochraceum]|uniref:sensor histidine kinase n=1 Tax=Virgisporangium ochraceum TaxID=65505 RepID=UPI001943508F|nr:ATP-binding protein [Virgisporangium ochraceum]
MWRFTAISRKYVARPLLVWALLLAAVATGVYWVDTNGHHELEHRFRLRVVIASDFVSTYAEDLIARERTQALQFLSGPTVEARVFEQAVASFGYSAAVLLDSNGQAIHAVPANPTTLGVDLTTRYEHLRVALRDGRPSVSSVVTSAAEGLPVVSFATPYETPAGRRVFAGAIDIRSSSLGNYLSHAIALAGSHVYLVDNAGHVVGANQNVVGISTLAEHEPELAHAVARNESGSYESDEEAWHYDSAPVPGTPWKLVASVRNEVLYQPMDGTAAGGWVGLGGLAVLGLFGVRLWARSARNRAELRESEERFRGLFDGSLVGMLLVGASNGRLLRVNPALCDLLGYRGTTLAGQTLDDIVHPDDLAAYDSLRADAVAGTRRGFTTELRFVDAMSRALPVALTATLVRDADGRPLYFAAQAVDVSERHRWAAEQRRIQVELTSRAGDLERANDALRSAQQRTADLVAMLSHDVRQPLGVITGYCEVLLEGWEALSDEKKLREVGRISRAGGKMMELVEEVLTLTEVDQGGLKARRSGIRMEEALGEALDGLSASERPRTRADVEPGLAVLADARHLQQILVNLLSNAHKYGGEDAEVRVQAGRLDNALVEIVVSDSGEGVPPEFVPHLFERFSRAASGVAPTRTGTGLGLYIVRELVEANGGTIRYEPNRPTGSRFVVELPADPARVRELTSR